MLFIGLIVMAVSAFVSWKLKSKFREYSQVGLSSNLSGKEIAEKMLRDNAIYDVKVIQVDGQLTDHYNPADKTVNLSYDVYAGRSVASAAVSAHECGHAVQHATAYSMLQFRSWMVPFLSITSNYMQWIILIGAFMVSYSIIPLAIGVALFALTTIFSLITLPVEYDASNRALAWIRNQNVVNDREFDLAKDALKWAARTYLVAAIGSIAQLLYLLSMLSGRSDD
ncbi:MAG: zinc metallopeptidase [Bacteroidota bacterium]